MGTATPLPPVDFNFDDSGCTTPYLTAPSSPQRFSSTSSVATIFHGGIEPSKHSEDDINEEDICDFAFEFSGPLEKTYFSAADELFDSGKIKTKPLKPTPQHAGEQNRERSERYREKDSGLFTAAAGTEQEAGHRRRGRESRSNNHRPKVSRSLSPFRVSDLLLDRKQMGCDQENTSSPASPSLISTVLSGKWKLKDLLLFRSASEGRACSTEKMKKYETAARGPAVSAHELHYRRNRTVSEELKRKTLLPYKQGLLGCLGFNNPEISCRGYDSISMRRSKYH